MTFKEEQLVIDRMINQLCLFSLQRNQMQSMRDIGVEVSSDGIKGAIQVVDVLLHSRDKISHNILSLLPQLEQVIKNDTKIKGNGYFESSQNGNSLNDFKVCLNCLTPIKSRNKKAKYCSNRCKTAHHRKKKVTI